MIIIRSFDVNKPGSEVEELVGGVAGGSILQGILRVGDTIEIRPGIISRVGDNQFNCRPITSRIVSLKAEQNELQFAVPGGLIGVGTDIDPQLCRADRLVGQVLGAVGQLPDIYKDLQIEFCLLRRLLGVRTQDNKRGARVENLQRSENLMINVGSLSSNCKVEAVNENQARISLQNPVCTEVGEKISISRKIDKHWRLIGWGKIRKGSKIVPQTN